MSHKKRVILSKVSQSVGRRARFLYISSAILALLAGGYLDTKGLNTAGLSQVEDLFPGWLLSYMPEITGAFAICSGLLSVAAILLYPLEETHNLYRGTADFLALREHINVELNRPNTTERQLFMAYEKINNRYIMLSQHYDKYCATHHANKKTPIGDISLPITMS
jgi:hypothetical protein